nr:PIN domain-containing protein [Natrinema caseinilyticum]
MKSCTVRNRHERHRRNATIHRHWCVLRESGYRRHAPRGRDSPFQWYSDRRHTYRPLYTSQAVLSELATLALYKLGHDAAIEVLTAILESESVNIIPVGTSAFEAAAEQFGDDDDQQISFVDHTTSILADERGVEHIFAFDSDFRTLSFSLVPADVHLPDR